MLCDIALKTLERAAEVTRRRLVKSTRPTDPIETEAGDELTDKSGGEQ